MAYQTSKIKDLSFALEALSRINGASNLSYQVETLLQQAIEVAKKENEKEDEPETTPPKTPNLDDEIHF